MQLNRISVRCETCGKTFSVQPCRQHTARFCSRSCLGRSPKPNRRIDAGKRFWARVRKTASCWIWTGSTDTAGYGLIRVDQKILLAHRFSWELEHGPITEGMCVLHNCPGGDNPACVNPAHLWLGTKGQNNTDRNTKGRTKSLPGEAHYRASLTADDVRTIRRVYATGGTTMRDIAATYAVSKHAVWCVIHRVTWKHV